MGYCNVCQSAGSVNRFGFCEICGTEHKDEAGGLLTKLAAELDEKLIEGIPASAKGGWR